jgi:hypothetical protein
MGKQIREIPLDFSKFNQSALRFYFKITMKKFMFLLALWSVGFGAQAQNSIS